MRTTITLEPDVASLVQRAMRERRLTFKQAVNEALRSALRPKPVGETFRAPTFQMGVRNDVELTKALRTAGAMEDEALLAKLRDSR